MCQKKEDIEGKFFSVITSLLGREPSKEEMQKILEPIYELGENARKFIFNILEDIDSEQDVNERIKKMEKFVIALKDAKDGSLDKSKPD